MSETLQGLLAGILLISTIGVGLLVYLTGILRKFLKGFGIADLLNTYDQIKTERENGLDEHGGNKRQSAGEPGLARKYEWEVLENDRLQKEVDVLKVRILNKDRRIAQLEADLVDAKAELQNRPVSS